MPEGSRSRNGNVNGSGLPDRDDSQPWAGRAPAPAATGAAAYGEADPYAYGPTRPGGPGGPPPGSPAGAAGRTPPSPSSPYGGAGNGGAEPPAGQRVVMVSGQESAGLWASMAVLGKRWPVVVVGVLLTAAAVGSLSTLAPPSYMANGTLLMLPPPTSERIETGTPNPNIPTTSANPYLKYGNLGIVGEVLATKMVGEDALADVERRGGTGDFKVVMAPSDAPIVRIDIEATTPEEALATYRAAQVVTEERLAALQRDQGAAEALSIRLNPINEPTRAEKDSGSTVRAMIAVIVLGTAGTISAAFGVESFFQYRAARRARARRRARPAQG